MEKMISELLMENSKFVLIGLTGRTGSGCTTAANILEAEQPDIPEENQISDFYTGLDMKRYSVTKRYISKHWNRFFSIKVSDLISAYLLLQDTDEVENFIFNSAKESNKPISQDKLHKFLNSIRFKKSLPKSQKFITEHLASSGLTAIMYKDVLEKLLNHNQDINDIPISNSDFIKFLEAIRRFTKNFKEGLNDLSQGLYISVYQDAGNSIRKIARIKSTYKDDTFSPAHVFHLPETMNRIIKLLRKNGDKTYIVIDAIRNPYEVKFFRDRYSAFHLVSINAPDKDRKRYLQNVHKFTNDQLADLDTRESGDRLSSNTSEENRQESGNSSKKTSKDAYFEFTSQNVKRCIEISDIHLFNPRNELENNNVLKAQLYWYIALMLHPGLITPTAMERVMQIAFTAKLNSGCLSRQVGAVVTDNNNSVKAIGWNDVAKGQVPCSLRSLEGVINDFDDVVYSEFERNDEKFRAKAKEKLSIFKSKGDKISGYNLSYCFKSLKNSVDLDKNQVHTRALHAEENAFLQISKYGGMGIEGGKLYTTASPCELCAKKAYQLGIKDIVFIDPYPGIAISHILSIGDSKPNLVQFRGAIGRAYHKIYEQIMPYKDELDFLGMIKN